MLDYMRRLCGIGLLSMSVWAGAAFAADATLLLKNGRVWTGNPKQPWAEAVAVEGNKIVAVGSTKDVAAKAGKATEVIDLGGRLVSPGFNDAHIHFLGGSLGLAQVDLTGACTLPAMQERISAWARKYPNEQWVTGTGWEYYCFPEQRLPTRQDLDAIVKDRPVFLSAYDGHTGWANSEALRIAGVTRKTDYSGFGEVVRDAAGEPTGCLKEGAQSLVRRHIPPPTKARQIAALRDGMKMAARLGITSIQNASGGPADVGLWENLLDENALTLRVAVAMSMSPGSTADSLKRVAPLRAKFKGPMLRVAALKIVMDGVIESHTAAMLEPYSDGTEDRGTPAWSADQYNTFVALADKEKWQIYTHAIGDRGVRVALDGYENAQKKNGVRDSRHRIEHIEVIDPSDIPRFAKLGVMPSMEPIHADPATVEVWSKAVGPKRLPYSFPWQALASSGAKLVFSSDWPAAISVNPIRGLHNAVNRQTIDGKPAGGWIPDQRVSVETALRAYTVMGSYSSFEESVKGTLAPGMLADIIVLSQNLFEVPPAKIHETNVVLTISDGKIVHRAL
ncbi:MAG: amidohydrolase [Bryobacteraceae bacterium]